LGRIRVQVQGVAVIRVTTMTNICIVMLPDRAADNDRYDYAYDYNYYIVEDDIVNLDI
jgi:hypothetical protein